MDVYGRTLVLGRSCKREVDGRPTKSPSSSGGGADCISFSALLLCFSRGSDVIRYHVTPFWPDEERHAARHRSGRPSLRIQRSETAKRDNPSGLALSMRHQRRNPEEPTNGR